jgi:hypothetical protein
LKFIYLKVWPTQPSDCPEMENPALSSPFRGTLQLTAPLSSYGTSVWMATPNVGDVVSVRGCLCTVKYVGSPRFADGVWVGVAFDTAIGRNDGMVEGISYFKCPPRHGLFVRPSQVLPSSAASSKVERDAPEEHVQAWKVQENVMEIEAIQAGRDGARVLKHLESNFPAEAGGASPSLSRSKPLRPSRRGPGVLGRQGSGTSLAGTTKEGDLAAMLLARYGAPPARYNGPSFSGTPTPAQMVELCDSIKRRVAHSAGETAVAAHVAITLMAGVKEQLEREAASVVELNITDGRIVVVGDTHGQLNDFCWILKVAHASTRSRRAATAPRSRRAAQLSAAHQTDAHAAVLRMLPLTPSAHSSRQTPDVPRTQAHGPPAPGNVYLVNGDIADRGPNAVEIYLILFGYMLTCPGCPPACQCSLRRPPPPTGTCSRARAACT